MIKVLNPLDFPVPLTKLSYTPQRYCTFSSIGEQMVNTLVFCTPAFHAHFNKLLPEKKQKEIMESAFFEMSRDWLLEQARLHESSPILKEFDELERSELEKKKKSTKKFFEKSFTWRGLVASGYRRTSAPRITASGGTLHAMKKEMSLKVLKETSACMPEYQFVDIDMSACHAHVADAKLMHLLKQMQACIATHCTRSVHRKQALQNRNNSLLRQSVLESGKFWDDYATQYIAKLNQQGFELTFQQVRKMLKVAFFTSLNGGNPFNHVRLGSNAAMNAPELLKDTESIEEWGSTTKFTKLSNVLSQMEIVAEVKKLNTDCVIGNRTYTVDRMKPYIVDSTHKGISRALQGVEVVLLAVLTDLVVKSGGIPINLAHDGLTAAFHKHFDAHVLCDELSKDFAPWSKFMLRGLSVKIEPKFSIRGGQLL